MVWVTTVLDGENEENGKKRHRLSPHLRLRLHPGPGTPNRSTSLAAYLRLKDVDDLLPQGLPCDGGGILYGRRHTLEEGRHHLHTPISHNQLATLQGCASSNARLLVTTSGCTAAKGLCTCHQRLCSKPGVHAEAFLSQQACMRFPADTPEQDQIQSYPKLACPLGHSTQRLCGHTICTLAKLTNIATESRCFT